MNQYGETSGLEPVAVRFAPHDWGVTTQKTSCIACILNLQDKALFLPLADKKVKKAHNCLRTAHLSDSLKIKEGDVGV